MAGNASQLAVCSTAEWTFNSQQQSPCLVGSALAGVCVGGNFTLRPLGPGFVYVGPDVEFATSCRCNTVYYSMLSACALCQGNSFIRWSRYSPNCSTVWETVFPQPLPKNISVPHWAYLNITQYDGFNATAAQAALNAPESTFIAQPTNTGRTESSGSGTNAGAIAGGVVGGVVFLAIVAIAVFFFLRRRKQAKTPPSVLYANSTGQNAGLMAPNSPFSPPASMSQYGDGSTGFVSMPSAKVYDPNDPSTWPTNNIPPAVTGQSSNSGYMQANTSYTQGNSSTVYSQPDTNFTQGNPGTAYTQPNTNYTTPSGPRYTGAPEI